MTEDKLIDILCFLRGDADVFAALPDASRLAGEENRRIYQTMLALHAAGDPIDEIALFPCGGLARQQQILAYAATEGIDDAGMVRMKKNARDYAIMLACGASKVA